MSELIYLTSKNSNFYKNKGDFLGLKFEGNDYSRVSLFRAFPLSHLNKYISVRDRENEEIGIIKDIKEFSAEVCNLLLMELGRRYFLPIIISINSIKEEFGYSYWDVLTDVGTKRFTIKKDNNSFAPVKENRILVIDVDGNRYEISDYTKLNAKSYRLIEQFL